MSEKQLVVTYDQDSKRYHRYIIDEGQGIVGNIYVPKDSEIPKQLIIKLRVKELVDKQSNKSTKKQV